VITEVYTYLWGRTKNGWVLVRTDRDDFVVRAK
jgi:hypothetical protein